jgi:hypothetical protein
MLPPFTQRIHFYLYDLFAHCYFLSTPNSHCSLYTSPNCFLTIFHIKNALISKTSHYSFFLNTSCPCICMTDFLISFSNVTFLVEHYMFFYLKLHPVHTHMHTHTQLKSPFLSSFFSNALFTNYYWHDIFNVFLKTMKTKTGRTFAEDNVGA